MTRSMVTLRHVATTFAVVLGFLSFGLLVAPAAAQQRPMAVQVDTVKTEPLAQTVPVLGRIVANQRGEVSARVSGPVAQMRVEVGDRVRIGTVVAILDMRRLLIERDLAAAELRTALSELETAEAEKALLEQERLRLEQLRSSAAFNRAGLDDKEREITAAASRVETTKAQIDRARANLSSGRADFNDAFVRAPYPGVVEETYVSEGAHVGVGDPVIALVNDSDFEIEAEVPVERVAALQPGLEVDVILDRDSRYKAELRAIVPVENAMTRTRAVRFRPTEGMLVGTAAGQTITIELPIGEARDVLSVHKDAVTIKQGERIVFVVDDDSAAQPRPVQLGAAVGSRFEVLSGLNEGDLVVVRGNERLRPGQSVAYGTPSATEGKAVPAATDVKS